MTFLTVCFHSLIIIDVSSLHRFYSIVSAFCSHSELSGTDVTNFPLRNHSPVNLGCVCVHTEDALMCEWAYIVTHPVSSSCVSLCVYSAFSLFTLSNGSRSCCE